MLATKTQNASATTKEPARTLWRAGRGWLPYLWYEFCRLLVTFGFLLCFSLRVKGGANLRRAGGLFVIANHQSFLDPVLVGVASPRALCYLARRTLFRHPIFAFLIGSLNAAPIDQEGIGIDGIRAVLQLLEEEEAVLIFPEGERTPNGEFCPLKAGILLLIRKMHAPIIPVGIAGAYDALPRWRALPHFSPLFLPPNKASIAVCVGKPVDSSRFAKMPRDAALNELLAIIKQVHHEAEALRRK